MADLMTDDFGRSALHYAAAENDPEAVAVDRKYEPAWQASIVRLYSFPVPMALIPDGVR